MSNLDKMISKVLVKPKIIGIEVIQGKTNVNKMIIQLIKNGFNVEKEDVMALVNNGEFRLENDMISEV